MNLYNVLIYLPEDLERNVKETIAKISSDFSEKLIPHIGVFTVALNDNSDNDFVTKSKIICNEISSFDIHFEKISLINDKYIFWEPDQKSKKKILDIHQLFFNEYQEIAAKNMLEYFDERKTELSKEEIELIKKTGSKYKFDPHLTLMKSTEKALEFFQILNPRFSTEYKIKVEDLILTKEDNRDNIQTFPVIEKIKLADSKKEFLHS